MVQIGLGTQLHQLPAAVLAAKRHPESLAILKAGSISGGGGIRCLRQIDQQQRSGEASKAFDLQLQESAPDLADRTNPAHQVASLIPALESARATNASAQHEFISLNWERIFAGFDYDRPDGGLEESLNCVFHH